MSEFCLSDKIEIFEEDIKNQNTDGKYFWEEDVKEFIRLLKEEFENNDWDNNTLDVEKNRNKIIDTLAGEDLR